MKDDIAHLASSAAEHQAERLVVDEPNRIAALFQLIFSEFPILNYLT